MTPQEQHRNASLQLRELDAQGWKFRCIDSVYHASHELHGSVTPTESFIEIVRRAKEKAA